MTVYARMVYEPFPLITSRKMPPADKPEEAVELSLPPRLMPLVDPLNLPRVVDFRFQATPETALAVRLFFVPAVWFFFVLAV